MDKDIIDKIVDNLEEFAKEYNFKFLFSLERKIDGALVLYFRENLAIGNKTPAGQSYRVSYEDRLRRDPDEIIQSIINDMKFRFSFKFD